MKKVFSDLFALRGTLPKPLFTILEITGIVLLIGTWYVITMLEVVPSSLMPSPTKVLTSYGELHTDDALLRNAFFSIKLNFLGYLVAVIISIPLGYMIGLFPIFRSLFNRPVDAIRFLPLTAVTGIFIAWFGIDTDMKVYFLAFGIIVYLLPIVVQRIDEVQRIYLQTVYTLGANKWQTIRSVFIPNVMAKLSDDIRVLVAISWTYIIVAELINKTGGLGGLAWQAQRQSRIDKLFAILIVIILIGFLQDKLFKLIDRLLFKHKYK